MPITASMVKQLRQRTGAGMMECKKVLIQTNGDMDAAIEQLRIKGAAAAANKADRIAAEGVIVSATNGDGSAMVEINCETDFVAKDQSFKSFCAVAADAALKNRGDAVAALSQATTASGNSVESMRQELIAKIGENISVRRVIYYSSEAATVSTYLHANRIGVMVQLEGGSDQLGRDIAMHIAASNPACISAQQMEQHRLAKEKDIFVAQAKASGKPHAIIDKMVGGRIDKFLKQNTLLGQPFVKNPEQTIAQLLTANAASVKQMVRFEVGEGLEKKADDFVAEVMAQAGKQ